MKTIKKSTALRAALFLGVAYALALSVASGRADDFNAREFLTSNELYDEFYGEKVVEPFQFSDEEREFALPFGADQHSYRASFDRELHFDCSPYSRFEIVAEVDDPKAIIGVILYFHSRNGWYRLHGLSSSLANGQTTFLFDVKNIIVEQEPAGLENVDSIRISFLRGFSVDAKVVFRSFKAVRVPYALIDATDERNDNEQLTDNLNQILARAGLKALRFNSTDVSLDALRPYPVVFLAGTHMNSQLEDVLCDYIDEGGKVVAFYFSSTRLLQKLGIQYERYVHCKKNGLKLTSMVFDEKYAVESEANGFPLPKKLAQSSWNFIAVKPAEGTDARVVARWAQEGDQTTEYPAVVASSNGAYCSHVLVRNDVNAETALMRSLAGLYDSSLNTKRVRAIWKSIFRVGAKPGVDEIQTRSDILDHLQKPLADKGWTLDDAARGLRVDSNFTAAETAALIKDLEELKAQRCDEYLSNLPSREVEGRLWWEHAGTGIYPGDWDRTMKELSEAGFTGVIPNLLWGGSARYKSEVLPTDPIVEKYGDQVEQAVAAGKKYGVEVHAWMVCFNAGTAPKEFLDQMRAEGRLQKTFSGKEEPWLCPSDPRNRELQRAALEEIATKYDIDGIHFDYIRFPSDNACFCKGCRERFAKAYREKTGEEIANFPQCTREPGAIRDAFEDWRCDQITALVRSVHETLKAKRPDLKFSAAVFPNYPSSKGSVGQDWGKWVDEGLLDFVCPMDYSSDPNGFLRYVQAQMPFVEGKIPIYPGIGMTATGISLTSEDVALQAELARQAGAQGFTIFNLMERSAKVALPALRKGVTSKNATAPHSVK